MKSKLFVLLCSAIAALTLAAASAQSPTPAVDVAGTTAQTTTTATKNNSMQATIKALRDLKEANEEILKKQQATLAALDELQKAADQIKIFSKRG